MAFQSFLSRLVRNRLRRAIGVHGIAFHPPCLSCRDDTKPPRASRSPVGDLGHLEHHNVDAKTGAGWFSIDARRRLRNILEEPSACIRWSLGCNGNHLPTFTRNGVVTPLA